MPHCQHAGKMHISMREYVISPETKDILAQMLEKCADPDEGTDWAWRKDAEAQPNYKLAEFALAVYKEAKEVEHIIREYTRDGTIYDTFDLQEKLNEKNFAAIAAQLAQDRKMLKHIAKTSTSSVEVERLQVLQSGLDVFEKVYFKLVFPRAWTDSWWLGPRLPEITFYNYSYLQEWVAPDLRLRAIAMRNIGPVAESCKCVVCMYEVPLVRHTNVYNADLMLYLSRRYSSKSHYGGHCYP